LYDTIHCNDIEQGGLGDCYFLAAISSIAEYPERLERLFLTKEYNPEGIYVMAMCISGIWQEVILDDLVPCTKYSKNPAFNRSKSHELWVILLEKAWAKIHGGYMNIAAGLTREALRDLTGASAITYFTS
jgi:calpain-15